MLVGPRHAQVSGERELVVRVWAGEVAPQDPRGHGEVLVPVRYLSGLVFSKAAMVEAHLEGGLLLSIKLDLISNFDFSP